MFSIFYTNHISRNINLGKLTLFSPPSIVHGDFGFLRFLSKRRIKAYSNKADNTRKIQTTRYRSTAFSWVEMGALSLKWENEIEFISHFLLRKFEMIRIN